MISTLSPSQTQTVQLPRQSLLLEPFAIAEQIVRQAVHAAAHQRPQTEDSWLGLYLSDIQASQLAELTIWDAPPQFSSNNVKTAKKQSWYRALKELPSRYPDLPLSRLSVDFQLSPIEQACLLLCLLPEIDSRFEKLFGYLHDDLTQRRPSLGLLLSLLTNNLPEQLTMRPLLTNGRLTKNQLLHLSPPPEDPTAPKRRWQMHPPSHLFEFLTDKPVIDPALAQAVQLNPPAASFIQHPQHQRHQQEIQAKLGESKKPPYFVLLGQAGMGQQAIVTATVTGLSLMFVNTAALLTETETLSLWQKLLRDGRLHQATLCLNQWETVRAHPQHKAIWQLLQHYPYPLFLTCTTPWQPATHPTSRPVYPIKLPTLTASHRLTCWRQAFTEHQLAPLPTLPFIADQFRFTPQQIAEGLKTAVDLANWENRPLTQDHLLHACRLHSNQKLGTLTTPIPYRYTWSDIVLAPDTRAQLQEITHRLRHRPTVMHQWGFAKKLAYGTGVAALFVGDSGTGKTMSASIIAGELGLDLYKIDLSSVVSKYIGETEKNLERIFEEAETSNAILFFDEADALFGKRGEVKDSHDRYANLEVSYLLQRIERFDGFVILASNLQTNIDDAFTRRLSFIIEFPMPTAAEREAIWRVSLPEATPLAEEISFARLAAFELTGGNIRNITLSAAFLAAAEERPLAMRHLLHATRREFQKLGRLIDESLFEEPTHD